MLRQIDLKQQLLRLFILQLLVFQCCVLFAQKPVSPYLLNAKRDVPFVALAVPLMVLSPILDKHKPFLAHTSYSSQHVWKPERWVTGLSNSRAATASDVLLFTSAAMPALLLINKDTRTDWRVYAMGIEAVGLTYAITAFTKSITDRKRPYVYNSATAGADIKNKSAVQSFFSGHTSMAAVSTFYFARVFADYHPNSKWKPWVWTMAVTMPLATASLRVAAGKHFPTDVLVGYIVGAGIGYLVPTLHKLPKKEAKPPTAL